MATKFPWPEIEIRLRQLRLVADDLKDQFPEEGEFFPRFADLADEVREAANDDCIDDASIRITDILIDLVGARGAQATLIDEDAPSPISAVRDSANQA